MGYSSSQTEDTGLTAQCEGGKKNGKTKLIPCCCHFNLSFYLQWGGRKNKRQLVKLRLKELSCVFLLSKRNCLLDGESQGAWGPWLPTDSAPRCRRTVLGAEKRSIALFLSPSLGFLAVSLYYGQKQRQDQQMEQKHSKNHTPKTQLRGLLLQQFY